jgi:hypothetical protein
LHGARLRESLVFATILRGMQPLASQLGESVTLRFRLPPSLQLCVGIGRWQPCIHQARVDVGENYDVEIRGYNGSLVEARRIVINQARRFLITIANGEKKLPLESFTARLVNASTPNRYQLFAIATGAPISITHAIEPAVVA